MTIYRKLSYAVLFLLVIYFVAISFLHPEYFGIGKITGFAVYDSNDAKQKIETAFSGASFMSAISNANICVQIKDNGTEHVFKVRKTPTGFAVANSYDYCEGKMQEDLIVKFASYDDFIAIMDDFTVSNIVSGMSIKYQILDSRTILPGGDVVCDDTFRAKFCTAVSQFATPEQLIEADMYCCIAVLTKEQQDMIDQHMLMTGFNDESRPSQETPAASGFGLSSYMFYAILGVLVLLGLGLVVTRKKPAPKKEDAPAAAQAAPVQPAAPPEDHEIKQIREYAEGTIHAGYSRDEVYQYLLQQGWEQQKVDEVFMKIPVQEQEQQQPQTP